MWICKVSHKIIILGAFTFLDHFLNKTRVKILTIFPLNKNISEFLFACCNVREEFYLNWGRQLAAELRNRKWRHCRAVVIDTTVDGGLQSVNEKSSVCTYLAKPPGISRKMASWSSDYTFPNLLFSCVTIDNLSGWIFKGPKSSVGSPDLIALFNSGGWTNRTTCVIGGTSWHHSVLCNYHSFLKGQSPTIHVTKPNSCVNLRPASNWSTLNLATPSLGLSFLLQPN